MFLASSSQYFILPTTVDLNLINITTGISFSFWARINATGSGNYGRIFDFGQISNVTNGINYILITRDGTTSNLKFEILNNASVVTNTTIKSILRKMVIMQLPAKLVNTVISRNYIRMQSNILV